MWTWLVLAGVLLAVEMMTGTLALLFAGLGALVAAGLAYGLSDSLALQIAVFAVASVLGTVVAWRRFKTGGNTSLDRGDETGQTVVAAGASNSQGEFRVRYRGSEWQARTKEPSMVVQEGDALVVLAQEGSLLIVGHRNNQGDK